MSYAKDDFAVIQVAALIEKEGKILLVQEGEETVKGKWNFPAGRIQPGEDPISGVIREAKEETGLQIKPSSIAAIQSFKDSDGLANLRFNFNCKVLGGDFAKKEAAILDTEWFTREEVKKLREDEQLRSEKTWLTAQSWFEGKEYPLETLSVVKDTIK